MDPVFHALMDALQNNQLVALATVVKTRGASPREPGAKMLVYPDGKFVGTIGGGEMELRVIAEARVAIREGKARCLDLDLQNHAGGNLDDERGEMDVFIEPLTHALTLVIVGAGHVGAAVAALARSLGFYIVVLDDRPEFVTPEKFPCADERIAGDLVQKIAALDLTPQTYVVLVTRAHALDPALLGALVEKDVAYIGMLGSDRRAQTAKNALKQRGVSDAALARVHAPIGIEINAETPQEIAVSIMAEIIQVKRKA
ncbi:MAG: XdhC family protein [Chloroflexi bacterium]|nr:XdhC family protein [Chloroflexota bacterium]